MTRRGLAPLGAIVFVAVVFASTQARAQPASGGVPSEAEEAFKQGLAEMGLGHWDAGCPLLEKAHRLAPNELGVVFTLAECEWKRGRIATASARYGEFLQTLSFLPPAQRAGQAERQKVAEQQRAELEQEVPRLTLVLPPAAPAGTAILLDGLAIEAPDAVAVDPGEHSVAVRLPSGATREQQVKIAKGERQRVVLTLPDLPEAPQPAAPQPATPPPAPIVEQPQPKPHQARWAMWTAGGVGAAGLGVGAVAGVLTFAKASDARAHCPQLSCNQAGLDAVSAGRTAGAVSTVAFVVGGVGLGAAVLIYVVDRRAAPTAARDAGGRRAARFAAVESLAIGLAGPRSLALRGAF